MNRAPFFLLLSGLLTFACRNEVNESGNPGAASEDIAFTFHCEQQRLEEHESPPYSVYAIAEEYKVKLAVIDSCTAIPRAQYGLFRIPIEALAATGGASAGTGSFFYALRDNRQINIFQGSGNPQPQSDPINYELLATYEDGRFHFHY